MHNRKNQISFENFSFYILLAYNCFKISIFTPIVEVDFGVITHTITTRWPPFKWIIKKSIQNKKCETERNSFALWKAYFFVSSPASKSCQNGIIPQYRYRWNHSISIKFTKQNILKYLRFSLQVRNQQFFRAGEASWNEGTSINIYLQRTKDRPLGLFSHRCSKNGISNETFNP